MATASPPFTLATAPLGELRRRRIIVAVSSIIERLIAAALTLVERHAAKQLTGGLTAAQCEGLEALLVAKPDTATSVLAWARQPPGAPGHTALKRVADQLACLRVIGLPPTCFDGVHRVVATHPK